MIGELILVSGSQINNFLPFFGVAPTFHSRFRQKFKNRVFEKFSQIITKKCSFQGPKIDFWIQCFYKIFWQGFKKATPYGCAWKLRLSRPSVRCVHYWRKRSFGNSKLQERYISYRKLSLEKLEGCNNGTITTGSLPGTFLVF